MGFYEELNQMLDKENREMKASPSEKAVANASAQLSGDSDEEKAVFTKSVIIHGNITTEGALDVQGNIIGNVETTGKLNISGAIQGNSQAAEIYVEGAEIEGELRSMGSVKLGQDTVIVGNVFANNAVIAGAIKGDIDVKGPVVLDTTAIVMGNIKSKAVQVNNGAVIEGVCSQCYADVNPASFFEEYQKSK